jgi:hypothetical protein
LRDKCGLPLSHVSCARCAIVTTVAYSHPQDEKFGIYVVGGNDAALWRRR